MFVFDVWADAVCVPKPEFQACGQNWHFERKGATCWLDEHIWTCTNMCKETITCVLTLVSVVFALLNIIKVLCHVSPFWASKKSDFATLPCIYYICSSHFTSHTCFSYSSFTPSPFPSNCYFYGRHSIWLCQKPQTNHVQTHSPNPIHLGQTSDFARHCKPFRSDRKMGRINLHIITIYLTNK